MFYSLMFLETSIAPRKDRNGMDVTEAEEIKRRWQAYTELYKKRTS